MKYTKYKLLKDLPGLSKGATFEYNTEEEKYVHYMTLGLHRSLYPVKFTEEYIKIYTDWFCEIDSTSSFDNKIEDIERRVKRLEQYAPLEPKPWPRKPRTGILKIG